MKLENLIFEIKYNIMMLYYGLLEDYLHYFNNKTHLRCKSNMIAVVTGGTRGIGKELVKMLLACDMKVLMGCRKIEDGKKVEVEARKEGITSGELEFYKLDLLSFDSIREFAKEINQKYPKINYLINNAAISRNDYTLHEDLEINMYVDHYAPFLLTHLLLPNLIAGSTENAKSRIVNTSSCAHFSVDINFDDLNSKNNPSHQNYSKAKLAQLLCGLRLARKLKNENVPVLVYNVHPGSVDTDMQNASPLKQYIPFLMKLVMKRPKGGAIPLVYGLLDRSLEDKSGAYISNCTILSVSRFASFEDNQNMMFDASMKILGIKEFGKP